MTQPSGNENSTKIRKVGIVGAGTMGAGIAAHLANSDIPVILLDIVTPNLSDEEQFDPVARNRHVQTLFDRMANGRPAQLGHPERAQMITLGNIEDDFDQFADCDWVIEVIVEKLEPKRQLMARLERVCKPNAIISSNTSGIPIAEIGAGLPEGFRARFLGTHFFNPPRYLKLLEIIPTEDTAPEIVTQLSNFARNTLGKGVVLCKDTPNFIANRFGAITGSFVAETALANGYSVADTDALLGPLIGRPKTGYFRLADLVGLDVRSNVLNNLYDAIPHDPYRSLLKSETFWQVFDRMIENGWLGNKAGQGFSKKMMVDGKRQFWTLDTADFEYKPAQLTVYPAVEAVASNRSVVERVRHLLDADDEGAWLVRRVIFNMLEYAAYSAPEIAYSLADVDDVVRWGFNYELGPFELWDALGAAKIAEQMEAEGHTVADWVKEMLAAGQDSFYTTAGVYDFGSGGVRNQYEVSPFLSADSRHFQISDFTPLESNESATLHAIGDGVLLLEFHSKANTLDYDIFALAERAMALMDNGDYDALVIGNTGRHFSAGARLSESPTDDKRAAADAWLRKGQQIMETLRHFTQPIVTAVHSNAFGGGAEISMAGWRAVAAHEVHIGLVEVNVGRIPAWSGITELMRRRVNPIADGDPQAVVDVLRSILDQLMSPTVTSSAWHAKSLGYLRKEDLIVMNPDHRFWMAKQVAIELVGQAPPQRTQIFAAGKTAHDELSEMFLAGTWSAYDQEIGLNIINVLTGGVDTPQWVDARHILDLERAASFAIRFDPRGIERMEHMLATGKPLRN